MKPQTPDDAAATELRRRAEERLQAGSGDAAGSRPVDDLEHLLHALRVHQVELELQNEELKEARAEVEAALERYADFYDFSPVGFFTLGRHGAITRVNLTGARLLGLERSRLVGRHFAAHVVEDQQQSFNEFLTRVFAGGEARQSCEVELAGYDRSRHLVQIDAMLSADGQECRAVVMDVSAGRQAAETLRESGQFNAEVIANAQEGIVVYGPDLRYRVWNDYMEHFTGLRSVDVLGRHPLDVFPFLKTNGVMANLEHALAGGAARSVEFSFEVVQSGHAGWALDRTAPLRNARGEIIGVIGTVSDITEKMRARDALSASSRYTRRLVDSMQDGFSAIDLYGVHLDVNPALCAMTGFSRDELVGRGMPHPYWPPEQQARIQAAMQKVMDGDPGDVELTFMRRSGERFPVQITPAMVTNAAGQIVSYTATVKDITERKVAEDKLRESQERFRDIVNTTDGIVWEADATTFTATFVSKQAERLLGYPIEDWLQPGFWAQHLHPDDRDWAVEYSASCARRKTGFDFEYRFQALDGRTVWLHDIVTVVVEDGRPRWLRGIMVDITRRRQTEEKLVELAESLEAKVKDRTAQLRKLSAQLTMTEERERRMLAQDLHDNLGQLLAVIKIKLTSTPDGSLQPSSLPQIVELVEEADRAARHITQQLSPPILRTLGLAPALEWLADEMQRVYGLAVMVDLDECSRRQIDEVQAVLYRSARELLINVAKHAGVGEASLTCMCDDDGLSIVVSDAGCGFQPADHFGEWSGHNSFGLRSIYERITNLGGAVDVDSSPGSGTTITLKVPRYIGEKEIR